MSFHSKTAARRQVVALVALVSTAALFAADFEAKFTSTPPAIDGTVDAAWSSAGAPATGFVDFGDGSTPSDQQTNVRMLWDSSKLYFLFEADDNEIVAPATDNDVAGNFDFGTPQDTAEIFLDPLLAQQAGLNDFIYHIAVNPASPVYTYTEAGQEQLEWDLGDDSSVAFSSSGTNWKVEAAIAWTDLNSTATQSPGKILGAPANGVIWGMQFGRLHGGGSPVNNTVASKWNPVSGAFRSRPFGQVKFTGGPESVAVDLSSKAVNYTTGFEAPEFTADATASGIEIWTATFPDTFIVNNSVFNSGAQALRADVSTPGGRTIVTTKQSDNLETPQYLQYALRLPLDIPGNGYRHVLYINGDYDNGSGGVANGVLGQIWFNSNNVTGTNSISVYNYGTVDGPSTTTVTGIRFAGLQAYDSWMYLTVKIDPVLKTYEVWLNDTKLVQPTGEDHFVVRNKAAFRQFTYHQFYNKTFGTEAVYFDDVIYAEDAPSSHVDDWQLF